MDVLLNNINFQEIIRIVFLAEFALLGVIGLASLLNLIALDREVRRHYNERLDVFTTFFKVYLDEKKRIKEKEEEKRKKVEAIKAETVESPALSVIAETE